MLLVKGTIVIVCDSRHSPCLCHYMWSTEMSSINWRCWSNRFLCRTYSNLILDSDKGIPTPGHLPDSWYSSNLLVLCKIIYNLFFHLASKWWFILPLNWVIILHKEDILLSLRFHITVCLNFRSDSEPIDTKQYLEETCKPKCVCPLHAYHVFKTSVTFLQSFLIFLIFMYT